MSIAHPTSAEQVIVLSEGDQACQAWLAFGESLLAFPNHVLHLTCDSPQESLFPNFPREWSKTDRPVISWMLL